MISERLLPCCFPRCPPARSRLWSWGRLGSIFMATSGGLFPPGPPLEPWEPGATLSPAPGPGPGPGPGGFADCRAANRSASGLWWSGPWWSGPWWWFRRVSMLKPPGWTSLLINLWRYWSGQRGGATVSFIVQPLLIHHPSIHSSFHQSSSKHSSPIIINPLSIHPSSLHPSSNHPSSNHHPTIHHPTIHPPFIHPSSNHPSSNQHLSSNHPSTIHPSFIHH